MLSKRPKIIIYSLQSLEEHFHHFLELFPFQVKTMIDHKPKWSISAVRYVGTVTYFSKKLDISFIIILALHGIFPVGVEHVSQKAWYKLYHPPRPSQHNYFLWVTSMFLKNLDASCITLLALHSIIILLWVSNMFLKKLDASFITLLTFHGIFPEGVERYKLYHPPRPSQHNYFTVGV